jgi:hypothetical protein
MQGIYLDDQYPNKKIWRIFVYVVSANLLLATLLKLQAAREEAPPS